MTKTNALNWFEIYVSDFDRAHRFYETILKTKLTKIDCSTSGCPMALFPFDEKHGVGGAITKMDGVTPGAGGTLVYLNVEADLDNVVKRVWEAGGTVVKPRFAIGEHGFIALFKDTEGNFIGLHSMS
ncbi:MAG: glyoxalase [Opitutia bacterium Tous-C4FEB]|nr:MAG: glyoxalase [Opitutae bacterium Tous-C4FEB]